jgi:XTP/dITP diphosphohydrolase
VKLLFGTTNEGKLAELRALVGGGLEVLSLRDVPPPGEVVEDGETFEANARKKARAYAQATGLPALADDSGLCVDALNGGPGVLSARYAPGTDADRVAKLLRALSGVPASQRGAAFHCALCLCLPDGREWTTEGECRGLITEVARGQGGFGFDPVFEVPGLGKTFAELSRDEKGEWSHRGKALRAMLPTLRALWSTEGWAKNGGTFGA